ncbi:CBU_0592 family membrane protein [Noviluteimonas gilva]
MNFAWYDFVGFTGTLMILAAFAAQQMGKMRGDGAVYQLLNLFGAGGILVSLMGSFNISVFVLESAWVLVSAYGLWRSRSLRARADAAGK